METHDYFSRRRSQLTSFNFYDDFPLECQLVQRYPALRAGFHFAYFSFHLLCPGCWPLFGKEQRRHRYHKH